MINYVSGSSAPNTCL